ncbi:hypothetical protein ABH935_005845 [Catenulispora sp. GAS73]|uniref:hypothetical protein n=1 Tax=Catenulispora sp. GAS73 TaxID=3156269 RepID=UPI003517F341
MTNHSLRHKAQQRSGVTGEPYREALARVLAADPGSPLIPAAVGDQLLLESLVFWNLIYPANYYGYVALLSAASPTEAGLTVTLGGDYLVWPFLELLLSTCSPDDCSSTGIPELRVDGVDRDGLHLAWRDSARLTVRGPRPSKWRKGLDVLSRNYAWPSGRPNWAGYRPGVLPHTPDHMYQIVRKPDEGSNTGWVASGLLRRIGALNRTGAYCVNAWNNGAQGPTIDNLVIDMLFAPGLASRYRPLIRALCDPEVGLAMTADAKVYWSYREDQLLTTIRSPASQRGSLQLRFSPHTAEDVWPVRVLLAEHNVPEKRLELIVPRSLKPVHGPSADKLARRMGLGFSTVESVDEALTRRLSA